MPSLIVIALGTLYSVLSVPFTACTRSAADAIVRDGVLQGFWWISSISAPFCAAATVILGIVPWNVGNPPPYSYETEIIICFSPILVNIFMIITTANLICLFPRPPVVYEPVPEAQPVDPPLKVSLMVNEV